MTTWTFYETGILLELINVHGSAWNTIAKKIKTRLNRNVTASSVRNRVQRIGCRVNKARKQRCAACGELRRGHVCRAGVDVAPVMKPISLEVYNMLSDQYRVHREACVVSSISVARDMGFDIALLACVSSSPWAPAWA